MHSPSDVPSNSRKRDGRAGLNHDKTSILSDDLTAEKEFHGTKTSQMAYLNGDNFAMLEFKKEVNNTQFPTVD